MLIYDTSGLKQKIKENNPKILVSEINKQNYNKYVAAYRNIPKQSNANADIRLDFVNGHF